LEKIELHPRLYRRENPTSFVGREYYINKIKDHLKNPGRRVSIVGLGGTGKSTLAFRALHVCEGMFYQIIPFYFESEYTIEEFTSQLANSLSLTTQELERHDVEDRKTILLNELSSRGEKRSLIFADNHETISGPLNIRSSTSTSSSLSTPSEDIKHIDNFLNRVPTNTSILLTSRERRNIDNEKVVDLEGLNTKEGKELFIKLAGSEYLRQDPPGDVLTAIEDLVERLGGHPLSIELLARTYVEGSPEEEIQNMSAHLGGVNIVNYRETQERLKSLKSCFEYSIRQLDRGLQEFLHFLVLFKSPFPLSTSQIFGAEKYYVLDLYNKSLLQRIDYNEYGKIREQEYWLYTFNPSMKIYLDDLTKNESQKLEIRYGSAFSEYYLNLLYDTYISIGKENHLSALARFNLICQGKENDFERATQLTRDKERSAIILSLLGSVVYRLGILSDSLNYFNKALAIDEDLNDRVGMARDYTNIGNTLSDMGNYQQALVSHNKALAIDEDLNDRVGMARDYTNIGNTLSDTGNYQQALVSHNKALAIDEDLNDRVKMAREYANIGNTLSDMGNYQQALDSHNKALAIHEDLNDRVGMAIDYATIGLALNGMNKRKEAAESVETGLNILLELEKETDYHHPLIERLKEIKESLKDGSI
jgi:tetratricopeptide (TPR) repeat protein